MAASTSIGQRFIQLIQHLGISKNAFAQSLDKTATVIQHLVDERNKPGYDLLCKVFEVYPNVSKDWLLLGQGTMMTTQEPVAPGPAGVPAPARPALAPAVATTSLFAATEPIAAPVPPVAAVPVAVPTPPAPGASPAVAASPPLAAVAASTAPDASYLAVALQTQYLQHQLALAEQRNQHLLEQQALMQQLVSVLQRNVG